MIVTFLRYVHADWEIISPEIEESRAPVAFVMQKQFERELKDNAPGLKFEILRVRENDSLNFNSHSFEYVVDMSIPHGIGEDATSVVEWIQGDFYDEGGLSGLFQLGDFDFREDEARRAEIHTVKAVVIDTIRIARQITVSQRRDLLDAFVAGDPHICKGTKKHMVDAAEKFYPYTVEYPDPKKNGCKDSGITIEHLPREFQIEWPREEE